MKTIIKTVTGILAMMCWFAPLQFEAQWEIVKAPFSLTDLVEISGKPYGNYKGLGEGSFNMQAFVETRKENGKIYFLLHTKSIDMDQYSSYSYRPGPAIKFCIPGPKKELIERENSITEFFVGDIGEEPFNQLKRSASATFDVEISYIVKDEKYGISGIGAEKGWGYHGNQIIKNVKADGVFWSEPIETTYPIEKISIRTPKITSYKANDSALQTAVQNYIEKLNKKNEADCKNNEKSHEEEKLKKQTVDKKVNSKTEEGNRLKSKVAKEIKAKKSDSQGHKLKTDDLSNAGENKTTLEKNKNNSTNNTGYAYVKIRFTDTCNKKIISYISNIFKIKGGCTNYAMQFHDLILDKYSKGCFEPLNSPAFVHVPKTLKEGFLFFDRSYFSTNKTDLIPHCILPSFL